MRIKTPKITGPKIIKGARFSLREAAADDPIYTRGFTIGGYYSKDSFPATAEKVLPTPNVPSQTPDSSKKKPAAKRTPPPTVAKDLPPWWNRPSPAEGKSTWMLSRDNFRAGKLPFIRDGARFGWSGPQSAGGGS